MSFQNYELLVGAGAIASASSLRQKVRSFVVDGLTPVVIERIRSAVRSTGATPASFVGLVSALTDLGVATTAIAQVLPVARAEVSRLRSAASVPALAEALQAGEITLHHARHLLRLPRSQLPLTLDLCVESGWSPAELANYLAGSSPTHSTSVDARSGDADLTEEETWLSGQLGTTVRIATTGQSGEVAISWSSMADLLGIMERLGAAPAPPDGLPVHRRELRIQYRSLDEYEAMVGHCRHL